MLGKGIEQLYVFAVFVVFSLALCAVYLFGIGLFRSRLATLLFDVIFGVTSLCATVLLNLAVNNGEFRLFVFVAMALGAIICVATCKTLLDKVSSALYNLFTTKVEDSIDESHIPQKDQLDTNGSGGVDIVDTGVHTANIAHANVLAKPTRGKTSKPDRRVKKTRRSHARTNRIYENRRVRKTLGRK
ncbi:MAG: spore cortex biosynthesis protein YabQ [Clostridia bacterium]|nr:spore cortex biosynthesis protein YabQ [Clostridia bacterium]